jgi:hypothetical protein
MRKELFDKLGSLTSAMRAITEKARTESRDLTTEEDQEWRRIEAEITSTETAVEREQREAQIAVRLEQLGNESAGRPAPAASRRRRTR